MNQLGLRQPDGVTHAEAIVIGASAGAVEALTLILPALPEGYALPIFIVVHLPPERDSALAAIFAAKCKVPVREAEDKCPIEAGTIYFAPPGYHLLVERTGTLALSSDEPEHFSRPSIDVLFESAADCYGAALIGVILTGANDDGAAGLSSICKAGGTALVQDPSTAEMAAMPEAALEACPTARKMALLEIADFLAGLKLGVEK